MKTISCEEFERDFTRVFSSDSASDRRGVWEHHRQICPSCRGYSLESARVRSALVQIPRLEPSPQFIFSLRRALNDLEKNTGKSYRPTPSYGLALSAGFATACLLGFLFLQPLNRPYPPIVNTPNALSTNTVSQNQTTVAPIIPETQRKSTVTREMYATQERNLDTTKHRLPEAPGKDQIPIPVQDDVWRVNQVSTTPNTP